MTKLAKLWINARGRLFSEQSFSDIEKSSFVFFLFTFYLYIVSVILVRVLAGIKKKIMTTPKMFTILNRGEEF